jgi:hypothetical protein
MGNYDSGVYLANNFKGGQLVIRNDKIDLLQQRIDEISDKVSEKLMQALVRRLRYLEENLVFLQSDEGYNQEYQNAVETESRKTQNLNFLMIRNLANESVTTKINGNKKLIIETNEIIEALATQKANIAYGISEIDGSDKKALWISIWRSEVAANISSARRANGAERNEIIKYSEEEQNNFMASYLTNIEAMQQIHPKYFESIEMKDGKFKFVLNDLALNAVRKNDKFKAEIEYEKMSEEEKSAIDQQVLRLKIIYK